MNILVPDSWLREHLKTKAAVKQIAKYLSLCSQSVEKVTKKDNDWIYEIEITTNRPDCLAIYGIARELAAILPLFGIKTKLQPLELIEKIKPGGSLKLDVKIAKASLCPRFTALIFDNIIVKPSPKIVRDRLEKCGIRALNNVVDISNYLMLELNQPMHTFDYDKIKGAKMILRESKKDESITTLDGMTRDLPEKSMIIEDGSGRIIDLCGTMGGKNSAVDENTKRVLLFVQTYDPVKIRQECQRLAFHTEASLRFEKGVEPERVMPAMKKAIPLFEKNCGARVASNLIDIYPNPSKSKTVKISLRLIEQQLGVEIPPKGVIKILESLGFKVLNRNSETVSVKVPSWRVNDVSIPEDLVEEVARIYGYHQLPSLLPTGDFPEPVLTKTFYWENKIKDALKNWGFTEIYSYSMQSKNLIEQTSLDSKKCLQIKNPLTKDLKYMRTSLIPSILQTLAENQENYETMKIFELANIYLPAGRQVCPRKNKLPEEKSILIGALTGNKFYEAKGVTEALLAELGITDYSFEPLTIRHNPYTDLWHPTRTALIIKNKKLIGIVAEIHPKILTNFGIKKGIAVFNLDATKLFEMATIEKSYTPIPKYPAITEDLCFIVKPKARIGKLIRLIEEVSPIIRTVKSIDSFDNQRTIRITYQHLKRTLNDKEIKKIRIKIIKKAKKDLKAELKALG